MLRDSTVRLLARLEAGISCLLGFALLYTMYGSLSWHARLVDEEYFRRPMLAVMIALFWVIAAHLALWGAAFAAVKPTLSATALLEGLFKIFTGILAIFAWRFPMGVSDVSPPPAKMTSLYGRLLTSGAAFSIAVGILLIAVVITYVLCRRRNAAAPN